MAAAWTPPILKTVAARTRGSRSCSPQIERHREWLTGSGELDAAAPVAPAAAGRDHPEGAGGGGGRPRAGRRPRGRPRLRRARGPLPRGRPAVRRASWRRRAGDPQARPPGHRRALDRGGPAALRGAGARRRGHRGGAPGGGARGDDPLRRDADRAARADDRPTPPSPSSWRGAARASTTCAWRATTSPRTTPGCARPGYEVLRERPTRGAGGCWVQFVHPKSAGGVLIELSMEDGEHGAIEAARTMERA